MRRIKSAHLAALLLTLLCAAGFSSCIRTDIGNTIGSIGKEVPKAVPAADYYEEMDCFFIRVVVYSAKVYEDAALPALCHLHPPDLLRRPHSPRIT